MGSQFEGAGPRGEGKAWSGKSMIGDIMATIRKQREMNPAALEMFSVSPFNSFWESNLSTMLLDLLPSVSSLWKGLHSYPQACVLVDSKSD